MPPKTNYYQRSIRTEIDLRYEMNNFFDGSGVEIPKKQTGVLRKMRRDENGYKIGCACVDDVTHEADTSNFCPYCRGESYFWDETFIDIFRVVLLGDSGNARNEIPLKPINTMVPVYKFYLRYSEDITEDDKIVQLVLDEDGDVVRPYARKAIYQIITAVDKRSDNGRLEYWEIEAVKEEARFLNGTGR